MLRVRTVPECGYLVVGRGTYHVGEILEPAKCGADVDELKRLLAGGNIEEFQVQVRHVPECGYLVIGRGTYQVGQIVDPSKCGADVDEVKKLLEEEYIEMIEVGSL